MVEAFSTSCSSANVSNSTGFLAFKSWSFISDIRVVLVEEIEDAGLDHGEEGVADGPPGTARRGKFKCGRERGFHY
jgi:hypothetical protein